MHAKMKKQFFFALASAVLCCACARIDLQEAPEAPVTVLGVKHCTPDTKTFLGEGTTVRQILWKAGDRITVNNGDMKGAPGVVSAEYDGLASALIPLESYMEPPYNVLYPAEIMNADGSIEIPEIQEFSPNSFSDGVAVAAGYAESDQITLKCLYGFVKFTLTPQASENIVSLTLEATGGEPVSGIFDVDYLTPALISRAGKDFVRVENIVWNDGKAEIVVSVPAGEYEGFRVRILSDAAEGNNLMQSRISKAGASVVVAAGTMVDMGTIAFNPNSRSKEITTAEQFRQFLSAASAGDFSAWVDEKSGEVLLGSDIDFQGGTLTAASDFTGILNGQGYSLKNLTLNHEIFTKLSGTVKNLVFDESCQFAVPTTSGTGKVYRGFLTNQAVKGSFITGCVSRATCAKAEFAHMANMFFGVIAGYSYGTIRDCINYTDIDITTAAMDAGLDMGCLVGAFHYTYSTITDCVNFGDFKFTVTGADNTLYLGGIVGVYTNSTLTDCINHGNITYNASPSSATEFQVGGVTGGNGSTTSCTLTDCSNTGDVTVYTTGTLYRPYVGGVMGKGYATIGGCSNSGKVAVTGTYAQKTISKTTYYPTIGGVIGINGDADHTKVISECVNTGKVEMNSSPASATYSRGAGIVGLNYGTVTNCTNKGAISILDCGKDHYAAGIMGLTTGVVCTISNCRNEGPIYATTTAGPAATILVAGIVGRERGADIINCSNEGEVRVEGGNACAGGIVGMQLIVAHHNISGCTNDGAIISHNTNDTSTDMNVRIGGIVGYTSKSYSTDYIVSACVNNAPVSASVGGSNVIYRVGGVVGYGAFLNIDGCVNNGAVTASSDGTYTCTRWNYMGGVVGFPCDSDCPPSNFSNCINNAKVQDLTGGQTIVGGLCSTNDIVLTNPGRNYGEVYIKNGRAGSILGGVFGRNSSSIGEAWSQCTVRNDSPSEVYVGGMVGQQTANGTISGGYLKSSVTTVAGSVPGMVLGNQKGTAKVSIGTGDNPILLAEECSLNGASLSEPPLKSELVGSWADESLVVIGGVGVAVPTTGLCSYNEAQLQLPGEGANGALFVTIGSEDVSIEATSTGWMSFAATTPKTAAAGTAFSIPYTAIANMMPGTRSCTVRITGKTSGTFQDLVFTQADCGWLKTNGASYALCARWCNTSAMKTKNTVKWSNTGYYESTNGNYDSGKVGGYISYYRSDENEALSPVQRSIQSYGPALTNIAPGDWWLITIPGVTADAGTWYEFYVTAIGGKKSPKYFVMEWLDGDEWKCDTDKLITAKEDPSLKYSYCISGDGSTHCTTFENSFQITGALNNENVYIRLRPVGDYAADGSIYNVNNTVDAYSGFMSGNYSAVYFNKLVGPRPAVKKKVLFIGNSLTYYHQTIAKTKELCWTQGLEIDAQAYLHGGAVYYEHMDWDFSKFTMAYGGYDYAILQCGARSVGRYGRWISPSGSDTHDSETSYINQIIQGYYDIVNWVKAYSPSCTIMQEKDWRTKSNAENYVTNAEIVAEGFTVSDANRMKVCDIYIERGTEAMRELIPDVWVSPVCNAFQYVWDVSGWGYNIYHTDDYHENNEGAYLKACVNALMLCGRKTFDSNVITIDGISEARAANYRFAAETAVSTVTYF